MKATVVVPTYNEAENLPRLATELFGLPLAHLELIVVDDASPDGTGQIAGELAGEYPGQVHLLGRPGKLGLGTAYVAGFRLALEQGADFVLQMDADFQHSPADVPRLLSAMEEHDVAVGSRYAPGGHLAAQWSLRRRLLSWGGNAYTRMVTGLRVQDTTAGFKCFRRRVLETLNLEAIRSNGYAFQIEMALRCQRAGFRVTELPIYFRERTRGEAKMSWRIIWEAAWRVWELRFGAQRVRGI
jgi:dolichol-phosphate mannosyltransferase